MRHLGFLLGVLLLLPLLICCPDGGSDLPRRVNPCVGEACPSACKPCGNTLLCQVESTYCVKETDLEVPLRDGVSLHTRVILPEGEGPFPVVLLRTAYWQLAGEYAIDTFRSLVADGYAFVYQSARGTGESAGVLEPLGQEFDDGEDTADWIAQQPWCNGRIGALGGSYEGYSAMAAAIRSPHIKVVLPDGYLSNAYKTWPATHNGIPGWTLLWWEHLVNTSEDLFTDIDMNTLSTNHRPYTNLDVALFGEPSALWQQRVQHIDQDAAPWRRWSFDDRLAGFCTPVLLLEAATEWEDDVLDDFQSLLNNSCSESDKRSQRFVLGAHNHTGAIYDVQGNNPTSELIRKYLATYLKQEEVGLETEPRVLYYVQRAGVWGAADTWPVAATQAVFHLDAQEVLPSEGSLSLQEPALESSLSYVFDPERDNACSNINMGESLLFLSDPIANPIAMVGRARVDLSLQVDVPDTDIFVYLYEVLNAGQTWNFVSLQAQRLRHRNSLSDPDLLVPDQPFELSLDMVAVGYQFAQGAKIAVIVASSECGSQENPNTGESSFDAVQTQPATIQVRSGPASPSRLILPIVNP